MQITVHSTNREKRVTVKVQGKSKTRKPEEVCWAVKAPVKPRDSQCEGAWLPLGPPPNNRRGTIHREHITHQTHTTDGPWVLMNFKYKFLESFLTSIAVIKAPKPHVMILLQILHIATDGRSQHWVQQQHSSQTTRSATSIIVLSLCIGRYWGRAVCYNLLSPPPYLLTIAGVLLNTLPIQWWDGQTRISNPLPCIQQYRFQPAAGVEWGWCWWSRELERPMHCTKCSTHKLDDIIC